MTFSGKYGIYFILLSKTPLLKTDIFILVNDTFDDVDCYV